MGQRPRPDHRTVRTGLAAAALAAAAAGAGCYAGARATADVNAAWVGRTRGELEARWGRPAEVADAGGATRLRWSFTRRHVELPFAEGEVTIGPGHVEGAVAASTGAVWTSRTDVIVTLDGAGGIAAVEGPSLRWGAPAGLNLRWGTIFGLHVGMGRLDDTGTALPSGGLYVGGMLGPRLGLAGTFALVSGKGDGGGALGFGWGVAAVWWPAARVNLRGGPALVLDLDPGFEDPSLGPGVTGGASYALVRSGAFVLDLRLDVVASPSAALGSVGIGVNVN